jgi:hypothetical protein
MQQPPVTPLGARTPHMHPALPRIVGGLIVIIVIGGYLAFAALRPQWPFSTQESPTPTVQEDQVLYRNDQFGFLVLLPQSWNGYTIFNDREDAYDLTGKTTTNNGVIDHVLIVHIEHPEHTHERPRQDIPIMVFPTALWVLAEEISVGAAPIPPRELARNKAYVFALPARYNYAFREGWEDVEAIIDSSPIRVFEPDPLDN